MKIKTTNQRRESGNTLMTVVVIGAVMSVVLAGILSMSNTSVKQAYSRADWNAAYYHAENALNWAAQRALDSQPSAGSSNYYSTANGTLTIPYMTAAVSSNSTGSSVNYNKAASQMGFKNAWVTVVNTNSNQTNQFIITASAKVNNAVRTVQTTVVAHPASQVFDYEYFLNNWGWWWGSTITGNGGQRANWDFDFQGSPTVNGVIYAAAEIQADEVKYDLTGTPPFSGLAATDPVTYVHAGAPTVVMPNLLNFTNYIATALANTASNGIWQYSTQVVYGVQSNTNKTGLYLVGTSSNPITVRGTVVIPGDLVISGKVTGKGTIYVGGNMYIANDLTYNNGPDFGTPPETRSATNRDAWVYNNANKDLIAYAVRGAIFGGDVTYSDWVSWCYNFPGSGLASVGDESNLGPDGINGTADDGTTWRHANGTVSAWYDADGDGKTNSNYNYSRDITMTTNLVGSRASAILNYPMSSNTNYFAPFSSLATDNMGTLEGIFYCNHALAMRLANSSAIFHGLVVSRNEQIIFQSTLQFIYDSRVHSRYRNNPNTYINLGLPFGQPIQVSGFGEMAANTSGL